MCTPKAPVCGQCPVSSYCKAFAKVSLLLLLFWCCCFLLGPYLEYSHWFYIILIARTWQGSFVTLNFRISNVFISLIYTWLLSLVSLHSCFSFCLFRECLGNHRQFQRIPTSGVQNLATRVLFRSCALGMPIWAHAPRVPNDNDNNKYIFYLQIRRSRDPIK